MISIRAIGADVTGRLMNERMSFHFILPLESCSMLPVATAIVRAVVWSLFRMDDCVRAVEGLGRAMKAMEDRNRT